MLTSSDYRDNEVGATKVSATEVAATVNRAAMLVKGCNVGCMCYLLSPGQHMPSCTVSRMCKYQLGIHNSLPICRLRPRQGGSTGWLLARHPGLRPLQWRMAACHQEVVQSVMLSPLLPQQFPVMLCMDANTRSNHHLAVCTQLWHPADMQTAAQRGVAACVSKHEACGCAHSHTRPTNAEHLPRYMHMHAWRARLHAGQPQLLRRLMLGVCHGTAGACPALPQVRAPALSCRCLLECWVTALLSYSGRTVPLQVTA